MKQSKKIAWCLAVLAAGSALALGQQQHEPNPRVRDRNAPVPMPPAVAPGQPGWIPGHEGPPVVAPAQPVVPLSQKYGATLPANVPFIDLPMLDVAPLLLEDEQRTTGQWREGVSRDIPQFDMAMGEWLDAADGGWVWVLDVKLPGAFGVRPHFTDFQLPPGAQAIVYHPDYPNNLPTPNVDKGPLQSGEFWGHQIYRDSARIEVYFPPEIGDGRFANIFRIDKVMHVYRDPMTGSPTAFGTRELGCHLDVMCSNGWHNNHGRGVGRLSYVKNGQSYVCSGSLIGTAAGDFTPFFLTARHCMEDRAEALQSAQVIWLYQSSFCNGPVPNINTLPFTQYASYVLTTQSTDMSLVMLEGVIPGGLWWNGAALVAWVAEDTPVVGIHHPAGTHKRWSWGTIWDQFDSCSATNLSEGNEVNWDGGRTERGSSGSPLFVAGGFVVGVDSCGFFITNCIIDWAYYGRWGNHAGSYQNILAAGSDDNFENNDSCGAATDLNGYDNSTFCNRVVKNVDEDWYRVSVPPFGNCRFETSFNNAWGNVDIRLHDGCGGVLAQSTSSTSNSEVVTWTNPGSTAREVYLRVSLANDTRNTYCIRFERFGVAAPANDACANATTIAQPIVGQWQAVGGTLIGANSSQNAWCISATGGLDVFYKFTSNCTQDVTFDTYGTTFDTVLSVRAPFLFSSNCAQVLNTQVVCNDDYMPPQRWSRVRFTAYAGVEYKIRVGGFNSSAFGNFTLSYIASPVYNDTCTSPIPIAPGTINFTNCAAGSEGYPEDVCLAFGSSQIYKDMWYEFTPTCPATVDLNTIGSNFDTRIAVYVFPDNSSCPPGPNYAILCNDDISIGNLQSQIIFATNPNQRYLFRVGSFSSVGSGNVVLNLVYTPNCGGGCDSIDFNNDQVSPDTLDITDFLSVFSGGPCSNAPNCNDIDFNNDNVLPDIADLELFLLVYSGGTC